MGPSGAGWQVPYQIFASFISRQCWLAASRSIVSSSCSRETPMTIGHPRLLDTLSSNAILCHSRPLLPVSLRIQHEADSSFSPSLSGTLPYVLRLCACTTRLVRARGCGSRASAPTRPWNAEITRTDILGAGILAAASTVATITQSAIGPTTIASVIEAARLFAFYIFGISWQAAASTLLIKRYPYVEEGVKWE